MQKQKKKAPTAVKCQWNLHFQQSMHASSKQRQELAL